MVVVVHSIRNLMNAYSEHAKTVMFARQNNGFEDSKYKDSRVKHRQALSLNWINLIKALGDMVTASERLGIPNAVIGVEFNDAVVGVGGFTSATLSCYQVSRLK